MSRFKQIKKDHTLQSTLRGAQELRRLIREWFRNQGFFEVETPALVRAASQEPYLSPFEIRVRDEQGGEEQAWLITSPEYAMKKLVAAGFPKIFEVARCFRNREPRGSLHNPEFTLLEWYRTETDYRGIMEDTEQMVSWVADGLEKEGFTVQKTVNLDPPWERLSVREAFKQYADVELENEFGRKDFEDWFFKTFLTSIEKKLGHDSPTILYDYPASQAALARLKPEDPRYAERFEVYMGGVELANAFSELSDVNEQRNRFVKEQAMRQKMGEPAHPIDEEFIAALEAGLPPCGGIALGVDRLAMSLLDAKSISEVLFFPYS